MKRILLLTTGGTITMSEKNGVGIIPSLSGDELIKNFPRNIPDTEIEVEEYSNIPSPWISPNDMLNISKKINSLSGNYDGVILTHGTDTLEETAYFLSLTVKVDFPVVLTAAMRAAPDLGMDGPRNLFDSCKVILCKRAKKIGVVVVINDEIFSPRDVTKISTTSISAFTAPNYGCIGIIDRDVIFFTNNLKDDIIETNSIETEVDLIKVVAGSDSSYIYSSLKSGAKGIVIEALGRGNVPPLMLPGIEKALKDGIPVIIAPRVLQGRVAPSYGYKGGGKMLAEMGCFFADDLRGPKSRIKLMIVLGSSYKNDIGRFFKSYV